MSIKKFNEHSVIDILKELTDQMVESGEADERDNDALYHLGIEITGWKNIKKNWKERFAEISKYIHDIDDDMAQILFDSDAENLETFKLTDDVWEFIAFSDGYEGCRVTFTNRDNKLKLVSCEPVGEDECEQYGMSDESIYKLLN